MAIWVPPVREFDYFIIPDIGDLDNRFSHSNTKISKSSVDFQGYDFGQPEIAIPDDETEETGPKTMTCPCCGEVFEV